MNSIRNQIFHIISNNTGMLKTAFRISPEIVIVPIAKAILSAVIGFFANAFVIRMVINGFQKGEPVKDVITVLVAIYLVEFLWQTANLAYTHLRLPVLRSRISLHVQTGIFEKNSSVDLSSFEDSEFFDTLSKASGMMEGQITGSVNSVAEFISRVISISMYSFLIFTIDPWLIIFPIIPVLSFIFLEPKLNVLRHDYDMETRTINRQRDYTKRTFYIADYAKEMRLTNIYKLMIKRYRAYSEDIKKVISKYGFRLIAFQMLLYAFFDAIVGQFAPMIYAVAKTLVAGTMLYGDCVVVISSVAGLTSVLLDVVSAVTDFQSNSLDIDEINKYVDHKTEINEGSEPPKTTGDIEFRNVSFTYPNTTEEVITDVSFTINQGEKIALMGYNGSGKSTLIKLMMRLYDPTGGVIRYNGTDIKDYRLSEGSGYRNRFGVQFQDYRLFAMSVRENVLMRECGDTWKDDYLVERSLRLANAYDMVCGFPDGTDSVLTKEFEKEGVVLSGGEAQKIAIARSFAKGGNIVILDEPSASLDPIAEDTLYKNILSSLSGNTVIFISHRVSSAVLADKILLMDKGRLAEAGSHTELMKQNGKYAEMFRMQAENYVEKV